jgi:shikimate dehydrogenase
MYPNVDSSPVELSKFKGLEGVFDCVYNPLRTNLILQAERLGIKCSGGLPMLIGQGLKAEEIWLEKSIEVSRYEEVLNIIKSQKQNIVLIGMPSCGKTTVAKLLAEKTGKSVIDTDELIYKNQGKKPSEIIEELTSVLQRGDDGE